MNAASILTFHDSVELFLHLACEELQVEPKKGIQFIEYWGALKGKLPGDKNLGYESQMRSLNELRVNLKHHGIMIEESEIERSRVNTTTFFEENTPIIFNVDFNKISMTDLVQYAPARQALDEATTLMEQEKFGEALTKIAITFDQIIDDYESRKKSRYGRSPFFFGDPLEYYNTDGEVKEFMEPMHEAMKILTLGLDYRRYVKFRLLVPELLRLRAKEGGVSYPPIEPPQNRTEEQCRFCYDFVIDSAIRIQDFDFDIEKL